MAGLVNYSAVLQDAGGSNLRFVASEHRFQTWGAGQSGDSGLSGILASSNHTTVMTIRGSNVGIGVTLPVAKLQVAGGVGIGTAYAAFVPPADGCIVAGNVGIGTTNPVATLQVAGSVGIGAAYAAFVPPADGCIVAGNVGIGTTNPLATLHVSGTAIFNQQRAIFVDQKASGTGGGVFLSGDWRRRDLNTVRFNNIIGCSLVANQIILGAGTYYINASAPAYNVSQHKTRLTNITTGSQTLVGTSEYARSTSTSDQTRSFIVGVFTTTAVNVFELWHRTTTSYNNSEALGVNVGFTDEIYSIVEITRIA